MGKIISIDPLTRLEGNGSIRLALDDEGRLENAFLQIPDFKGFEKFCEGRAVEELPTLTQKICGVCPTAHHIAGVKALDHLFSVTPPPPAKTIRELMHHAFIFEDHLLHFYFLGGPDFIVGPAKSSRIRNIFGVIEAIGHEQGKTALAVRRRVREMHGVVSGGALYPVCGLPGGVSRPVSRADRDRFKPVVEEALALARRTAELFHDRVLENKRLKPLLTAPSLAHETYYMGMVDEQGRLDFYDGAIRVVDPEGREFARFSAGEYLEHLAERVDAYSYMKPIYLKNVGWRGLTDGRDSGIYRVGPLARLNAADGLSTPLAQAEYERMGETLGGWPIHHTFAYHWARIIEMLHAAEKMVRLVAAPELTDPETRTLPGPVGKVGVGACEAPRGTLIHHYEADARGIARGLDLLVATQHNAAGIQLSIVKAARDLLKQGRITDTALNMLEMVTRAYDPCMACAAH